MIAIGIIVGVLYLIILFAVCFKFASIAEMKGHNKDSYFSWCFFCGIFGMLAVIALPDRNVSKSRSSSHSTYKPQSNSSDELPDL